MTTSEEPDYGSSRGGFVTRGMADALRQVADAQHAVEAALPVRIFERTDDAKAGVVAHFKHEAADGWSVFGDITRGSQGLVISRLEISPAEESSGVTAALLRKIPVGEIITAVRTKAAWEAAQRAGTKLVTGQEAVPGVFDEGDGVPKRRSGRAPLTQDLLRQVALAYIDENAPGKPSGAMKRIADQFGKPEQTARNWVARARRDGWLGPSVKGRTGAEPGPKLRAWIRQALAEMHSVEEEARSITLQHGGDPAVVVDAAVKAYNDIAERDISHRMGLPPLEAAVIAQVLYGQSLSRELRRRESQPHTSAEVAFHSIAVAMKDEFDEPGITAREDAEAEARLAEWRAIANPTESPESHSRNK